MKTYSSSEVRKATGITPRQIDYWARTGLVRPSGHVSTGCGNPHRWTDEDIRRIRLLLAVTVVEDLKNDRHGRNYELLHQAFTLSADPEGCRWLVLTANDATVCSEGEVERLAKGTSAVVVDLEAL